MRLIIIEIGKDDWDIDETNALRSRKSRSKTPLPLPKKRPTPPQSSNI